MGRKVGCAPTRLSVLSLSIVSMRQGCEILRKLRLESFRSIEATLLVAEQDERIDG